jgi:hypothetical protein
MRLRTISLLSMAALGLTLTWGPSTAAAKATAADATGTWKWSTTRQNGDTVETVLKLKQDGEKLTGTITGFQGNETEIKDGKIKDGAVSFSVVRERNGQTTTQKYTGTLEGDSLKGKVEFERGGETQSREFVAKRGS